MHDCYIFGHAKELLDLRIIMSIVVYHEQTLFCSVIILHGDHYFPSYGPLSTNGYAKSAYSI